MIVRQAGWGSLVIVPQAQSPKLIRPDEESALARAPRLCYLQWVRNGFLPGASIPCSGIPRRAGFVERKPV